MRKLFAIVMLASFWACENPYDNVSGAKHYTDKPLVTLSSDQVAFKLEAIESDPTLLSGTFRDSLLLSHKLDQDISVTLKVVGEETFGDVAVSYFFDQVVSIEAGKNYGYYSIDVENIPVENISRYKLSLQIDSADTDMVIAGMFGAKKEDEARKKRFKTYSFSK